MAGNPLTRPALGALAAAALLLAFGCGEDVDAPLADLPPAACPHVDEALQGTLAAIDGGALAPLAAALESLATPDGDDPLGLLLGTLLAFVERLSDGGLLDDLDAPDLRPDALAGLGEALADALAPFIAPPAGSPQALDRLLVFDALAEAARTCPEGTLTGTLRAVAQDRPLIDALVTLAKDPRFLDFFAPLLDPAAGQAGRRALVALLITLFDLLAADPFDFDALAGVFGLIIPADEPPMRQFLDQLDAALDEQGLPLVQAAVRCVDAVERVDSEGRTSGGARLLGDALYDILAAFGPDPSAALDLLGDDPGPALDLVDHLLAVLQSDPDLRQRLIDLASIFLAPDLARPLLEGAAALLDAGALEEIAALALDLLGDGCGGQPRQLTATLAAAFGLEAP